MIKDFKEFVMKGNVLDLAVGVIIGAAFGKIVSSLVQDVIMPPIGMAMGKVDFANLFVSLSGSYTSLDEAKKAGAPVIAYGVFLNTVIEFLIIAFCVFLIVRAIASMQRKPEEQAEETKTKNCPYCLSVIPVEATRCSQCTSEVGAGAPAV